MQWVDSIGSDRDREHRERDWARDRARGRDREWWRQPPSGWQGSYQQWLQLPTWQQQQWWQQPQWQQPQWQQPQWQQPQWQQPQWQQQWWQQSPYQTSVSQTQYPGFQWVPSYGNVPGHWERSPYVGSWYDMVGPRVGGILPQEAVPLLPAAAVVDAPLPTQANRDILPMSTGVPILPTQSAQITGRPQTLVFKIGRFVISNAGTAGGAADWIVNDIKIGNVSQFVQSGDVPGDMFATNAIDTFVRFAPAQTAMDVVVVVTYIGLNESGCPFFGAMVGTAAV
jgi:hypothetical protein